MEANMFFEALILGVIIGFLRRGKLNRFLYINFSYRPLIYISALFYLAIIVINLGLYDYDSFLYGGFLIGSMILSALFLVANLNIKFMFLPLIGLAFNLFVFLVNKFKFPLSLDATRQIYGMEMAELLKNGNIIFFTSSETANFSFLGSIIPLGNWFIVSIGDLIIAIGLILVVQGIMSDRFIQNRSNITFSKNIFR